MPRRRAIGKGHTQHRSRTLKQCTRIGAQTGVFRHIVHAGMPAVGNPTAEERGVGLRKRFCHSKSGRTGTCLFGQTEYALT